MRKIEFGKPWSDSQLSYADLSGNVNLSSVTPVDNKNVLYLSGSAIPFICHKSKYGVPTSVSGLSNCTSLKKAILLFGNQTSLFNTFFGCSSLEYCYIDEGFRSFDDVFNNCTSLKMVIMPTTTSRIYKGVFEGCSSLKLIYIRGTEKVSGFVESTFNGINDKCKIIVPKELYQEYIETSALANVSDKIHGVSKACIFHISNEPEVGEKGFTWSQWTESEFCNDNYSIVDGYVVFNSVNYVQLDGKNVREDDVIIHNAEYSTFEGE